MVRKPGPRIYDWRPAPFGRARKVSPLEARRWERSDARTQAPRTPQWRSLAPVLAAMDEEGLTVAEQAARLGLKRTTLAGIRARLIRAGLLIPRGRGPGNAWSWDEELKLIDLVEQGYGYDALAKRMQRTRTAIVLKCKRLGVRVTTTLATLSARDVALLLGKGCAKSVVRWIHLGWLKGRNAGGAGHKALWRVQWDDLTAFMANHNTWMAWDAERVTDPALREWALELRQAAGGEWLTIGQVATRFCVDHAAVNQWVHKGFLPAVDYGNWWFWSADIEGWLPPCERSKAGIPKAMGRRVVGKADIVAAEKRRKAA
jgi:hypothetical protein